MSVYPKIVNTPFLLAVLTIFVLAPFSATAKSYESAKAHKADLDAQIVEIKADAAVAVDISLNALSNVIASFNDTEKTIANQLHAGNSSDLKSMIKLLEKTWKSEKDVLEKIDEISEYVAIATSALNNIELQLKQVTSNNDNKNFSFKKADKSAILAHKYIKKATEIAEKLKQTWLVPLKTKPAENK